MLTEKSEKVKVMLRRLPKYMTEKEVMEQISPLPEEVVGTYFYPANFAFDHASYASLALVFSEYCNSLMDFERRFDGYIFVDSRGNDSASVVEAAVNQNFSKCDRGRMTEDTRVGAILNDKYYLEFCEKLNLEKAVPIMTLEQQIRKLNQPEDARTQIDRLETPLVKYFIDKEYRRRSDYDVRKAKRELKKAEKHKNVMEFLMKPPAASGASGAPTTSSGGSRRLQKASEDVETKANRVMTEKEKEKLEKVEARRKERNAIRKQKFLEEKKRKMEETSEGIQNPQKLQKPAEKLQKAPRPPRGEKQGPKKSMKPPRPSPAKTVGEQQGEDWIKKLTDPKAPIKKKHDLPVTTELKPSTTVKTTDQSAPPPPQRPRTAPTTTTRPPRHPKPPPSKRPQTAPK